MDLDRENKLYSFWLWIFLLLRVLWTLWSNVTNWCLFEPEGVLCEKRENKRYRSSGHPCTKVHMLITKLLIKGGGYSVVEVPGNTNDQSDASQQAKFRDCISQQSNRMWNEKSTYGRCFAIPSLRNRTNRLCGKHEKMVKNPKSSYDPAGFNHSFCFFHWINFWIFIL